MHEILSVSVCVKAGCGLVEKVPGLPRLDKASTGIRLKCVDAHNLQCYIESSWCRRASTDTGKPSTLRKARLQT
jgi:hypothetical protein